MSMTRLVRLILLTALFAVVGVAAARASNGLGAFFTQVNTYVYTKAPGAGPRYLVRPRQALTVLDLRSTEAGVLWYQIEYTAKDKKLEGEGWIMETPHEILAKPGMLVTVFLTIPDTRPSLVSTVSIPVHALKLLDIVEPSTHYAEISWQKVRYKTNTPLTPWIRAATGIYRPGIEEEFITRVYATMVARQVPVKKLKRLISGVIQVGDSQQDVTWSLGEPLNSREETTGDTRHVFWQYGSIVVQFENSIVKLIN